MLQKIGIRYEDKYKLERRVALIPQHIKELIDSIGLKFEIQTSEKRIFSDKEFEQVGAQIVDSLENSSIIMGVKEMPIDFFEATKTYIFFSHVIKGQEYNMPMLKKMMELKCNLIDYEKVADEKGRRIIFFGKYAGLAGMINSLWSLGQRLKIKGYDTPFLRIKQSYTYNSLEEAKEDIRKTGQEIKENGLPKEICPLTIGFTGYGNVSKGAQEITNLLPTIEISPEELLEIDNQTVISSNLIYNVVFEEKDISKHKTNPEQFELQHYYNHPEEYINDFEKYVPNLSVLMNCMYWDDKYPRIISKNFISKLNREGKLKLEVIGDVTCDPDGSIELTHMGTHIEDPVFVYSPVTGKPTMGFDGEGILIMAVDILPSELPRESSEEFSNALKPFMEAIATADYNMSTELLNLPDAIKKALILHKGELTEQYKYIEKFL